MLSVFVRINGKWEKVEETHDKLLDIDSRLLYADVVCKLTKNISGPAFEVKATTYAFHMLKGPEAKSAVEQLEAQFFGASVGTSASVNTWKVMPS